MAKTIHIVMLILLLTISCVHVVAHFCAPDWLIIRWGLKQPSWWSTAGILVMTAALTVMLVHNRRRS